jgi:two-component system cell cycle sensor histidine kinase/response regulator CckA
MPPKILFQTELTEQECLIQADPCQIQQMLVNLCLNARDAMDEGGTLTIRSRRVQQEQLSVETKKEIFVKCPRYAAIDVCDTGCGMPPENVQKIFDPFFTTKPKDLGTGLGLSLVHKIVEAHHGSIKVASRPGTGTRFSIYFPETAFEENQTLETLNSGEGHILIVEDEEMVAGILRTLLENKGYTVKQVSTVQKALSILEAGEPHTHLVILNYCLAGKHKGELFEQLRAIDTNLKLIVISNEAIEAIDWDPSRYRLLHKPFSIPQINQAVAELANTNSKRGDSVQAS